VGGDAKCILDFATPVCSVKMRLRRQLVSRVNPTIVFAFTFVLYQDALLLYYVDYVESVILRPDLLRQNGAVVLEVVLVRTTTTHERNNQANACPFRRQPPRLN
jgi:hypothetical protein